MMRLYQKATSDINKINRDNSLIIIMQETSFCSTFYFKMSHKRVASGGKFRDLNFLQVDICCWWLVSRPEPVKAGMVRRINLLLLTWTEWFFGRSSCQTTVSRRAEPSRAEQEGYQDNCLSQRVQSGQSVVIPTQGLSFRRAAAMLSRDFLAFFISRSVVQMQNTDLVFVPIVCGEWEPPSLGCGGDTWPGRLHDLSESSWKGRGQEGLFV